MIVDIVCSIDTSTCSTGTQSIYPVYLKYYPKRESSQHRLGNLPFHRDLDMTAMAFLMKLFLAVAAAAAAAAAASETGPGACTVVESAAGFVFSPAEGQAVKVDGLFTVVGHADVAATLDELVERMDSVETDTAQVMSISRARCW